MLIQIHHKNKKYACDLSKPLDISIPIGQVKCFYAPDLHKSPYKSGDFIGSVAKGAPVNFYNISLNPHGNGTHTESLGHITEKQESLNQCLRQYHFLSYVVSVPVDTLANGDRVISAKQLESVAPLEWPESIIIRTLPNSKDKQTKDHSGTNPPYLTKDAMELIVAQGVKHLLLDLPSVDRELDEGKLENHRIFWNVRGITASENSHFERTITELIYVPNEIEDGMYLLNIQLPSLELDAIPSKPVLYRLKQDKPI